MQISVMVSSILHLAVLAPFLAYVLWLTFPGRPGIMGAINDRWDWRETTVVAACVSALILAVVQLRQLGDPTPTIAIPIVLLALADIALGATGPQVAFFGVVMQGAALWSVWPIVTGS